MSCTKFRTHAFALVLFALACFSLSPKALAACASPAGVAGEVPYNTDCNTGEHYFRLHALAGGGTRLTHGEVFGGLLVPLLWGRLTTKTRQRFQDFNAALRARAERERGQRPS